MFERLKRLCDNVLKLDQNKIFMQIMQDDKVIEFTLDLNRFEQLFLNSVDSEGVELPKYSRLSEDLSINESYTFKGVTRRKTRGDAMFLLDTGEFYDSFNLVANDKGFAIRANTIKDNKDLQIYGDIIGLTEDSKNELSKKIIPNIIQEVKRRILG
jgi:hypothetical protein